MAKKMEKQLKPAKSGVTRLGFVGEKKVENEKIPNWMKDNSLVADLMSAKTSPKKDVQLAKAG
jgi:hypothetical protein